MSNDVYEFSAKNVDDAIMAGLKTLGLRSDQVDIDIINKGSRGILGFGGEPASVRITPRAVSDNDVIDSAVAASDAPPVVEESSEEVADAILESPASAEDEPEISEIGESADESGDDKFESSESDDKSDDTIDADADADDADREMETLAQGLLARLMELMGFDIDIVASWNTQTDDDAPYLNLDIRGDDLGVLIGRRGETLANIQFLLRLMVNQQMKEWTNITVDVEQYKERRIQQLTQLADRMAEQVATGGHARSYRFGGRQ